MDFSHNDILWNITGTFIHLPSFCLDWSNCTRLFLRSSFTLIWGIYTLTNPSTPPQFFRNCCRFCPHSLLLGIWRLIQRLQYHLSIYKFCCLFSGSFSQYCLGTLYMLNISSHQDEQAKEAVPREFPLIFSFCSTANRSQARRA